MFVLNLVHQVIELTTDCCSARSGFIGLYEQTCTETKLPPPNPWVTTDFTLRNCTISYWRLLGDSIIAPVQIKWNKNDCMVDTMHLSVYDKTQLIQVYVSLKY